MSARWYKDVFPEDVLQEQEKFDQARLCLRRGEVGIKANCDKQGNSLPDKHSYDYWRKIVFKGDGNNWSLRKSPIEKYLSDVTSKFHMELIAVSRGKADSQEKLKSKQVSKEDFGRLRGIIARSCDERKCKFPSCSIECTGRQRVKQELEKL